MGAGLVDGDGSEFAGCDPRREICDSGVVNDGHDNVTIRDGGLRGFGIGILIGTTTATRLRGNRVLGVSALRNQFVGGRRRWQRRTPKRRSSPVREHRLQGTGTLA
jgi:hypothetical protein